jgi:hypothetical protein
MDTGHYRCTDTETKTRDWVSLNFDQIPTAVVVKLVGDNFDLLERVNPVMKDCDVCDGSGRVNMTVGVDEETTDVYEDDCTDCEDGQVLDYDENMLGWPAAWGTMWRCTDHPAIREALDAAGFIVYMPDEETDIDALLFGVDGCGYSFYGAHWIPLRAHLDVACCTGDYPAPERLNQILTFLHSEAVPEGDGVSFLRQFGKHMMPVEVQPQDQP